MKIRNEYFKHALQCRRRHTAQHNVAARTHYGLRVAHAAGKWTVLFKNLITKVKFSETVEFSCNMYQY